MRIRKNSIAGTLALIVAMSLASCHGSPTGPEPSGLRGTWTGTAFFGVIGAPQPIQLTFDSDGATFGGNLITDRVPDGPMGNGVWDGTKATWETHENSIDGSWSATISGSTLSGFMSTGELSFSATRL